MLLFPDFSIAVLADDLNSNDIVPITALWVLFLILLIPSILYNKLITVDSIGKTITITRYFTRLRRTYKLSDYDGYVDMVIKQGRGNPYVAIYLVKDEKFVQVISGNKYSNLKKMEDGISDLKYLGQSKSSILLHLKILFGYKVMYT